MNKQVMLNVDWSQSSPRLMPLPPVARGVGVEEGGQGGAAKGREGRSWQL